MPSVSLGRLSVGLTAVLLAGCPVTSTDVDTDAVRTDESDPADSPAETDDVPHTDVDTDTDTDVVGCDVDASGPLPTLALVDITPDEVRDADPWGQQVSLALYAASAGDLDGDCACEGLVCTPDPACTTEVYFSVGEVDAEGDLEENGKLLQYDPVGGTWSPYAPLPRLWPGTAALKRPDHHAVTVAFVDLLSDGDPTPQLLLDDAVFRLAESGVEHIATLPPPTDCPEAIVFALAQTLVDLDRDGWIDLAYGTDDPGSCATAPVSLALALQTAPGVWTWADLVQQSAPHRLNQLSAVYDHAGGLLNLDATGDGLTQGTDPTGLYREGAWVDGLPTFSEVDAPKLAWLAPMGGDWCDLDRDGWLERIVSIGDDHLFIASYETFAGKVPWSTPRYDPAVGGWFDVSDQLGLDFLESGSPDLLFQFPWGVSCVDLDLDTWPDVLAAVGDDELYFALRGATFNLTAWRNPGQCPGAWTGFQRWPTGDEAGALAAMAQDDNNRGLQLVDLDHDGDADVLLGGAHDHPPRVLRNDTPGNGLTIALVGTVSGPPAFGAEITVVTPDGTRQRRQLGTATNTGGLPRSEWSVGLGGATTAEVTVAWPSGLVQRAGTLDAGTFVVVREPEVFRFERGGAVAHDRRLSADAAGALVVCPVGADGSRRYDVTGVAVSWSRRGAADANVSGAATYDAPAAACPGGACDPLRDGCTTFPVVAGDAAGTLTATVTVDGVQLAVRPKVWIAPE